MYKKQKITGLRSDNGRGTKAATKERSNISYRTIQLSSEIGLLALTIKIRANNPNPKTG